MTNKPISPEDLISDTENFVIVKGVQVRKGTVGAFLANANILSSETANTEEKQNALRKIKDLAPAIAAIEMSKHVVWKNPLIQSIIDEAENKI